MLNLVRASITIGLSHHNVTVLRTTGWRPVTSVIADVARADGESASMAQLQLTLDHALKEVKGQHARATVVLADDSVRYFSVTPPQNLTRLDDCKAAAAMRFQTLYGETTTNWILRGDWNARNPFLVCAMPTALDQCLQSVAASHHFSIVNVVPHFVAVWNRHRRVLAAGHWLGLIHEQTLTLGAVDRGQLAAVRATRIPDGESSSDWFAHHLAREALRLDLSAPTVVHLCGDIPSAWLALTGTPTCKKIDDRRPAFQSSVTQLAGIRLARAGIQ